MLTSLDEYNLAAENASLDRFYDSVRRRIQGVDNAEGKQRILHELYDKFFRLAFRRTTEKLGIVYTPVEIVDFILRSADDVLRAEFGQGLSDEGVHILDGFTGTGTFIVRLLRLGLITPHDLARKYANELHANEILLLAYYVATVNIATTYYDLSGVSEGFPGLVLTDTFQSWEPDDRPDLNVFPENNARLERLKKLPITVIVGNPPYSAGQDSANDQNANERYPFLDDEIRRSYAEPSAAVNKNSLYDSYIRAIRWASLRIKDRGVIAYVTNGGFLDSNTADGMRKALVDDFSTIYIYNLRGNQRTAGEESRREGGKVFGAGSRATVAITVLVRNPRYSGPAVLKYTDIGDYLSTEQKLAEISSVGSVAALTSEVIVPNEYGDWLNQRRDDFKGFLAVDEIFRLTSGGLKTNRDAWVYNFGAERLCRAVQVTVDTYHADVTRGERTTDPTLISWSGSLEIAHSRQTPLMYVRAAVRDSLYRPFTRQHVYYDALLNERRYRLPRLFPSAAANPAFVAPNPGSSAPPFLVLAVDALPDMGIAGISAVSTYARWQYASVASEGALDLGDAGEGHPHGYRKIDNIADEALAKFRSAYPRLTISGDEVFFYVYGLLHSPVYRERYAADLKKTLPRIPFVRDFTGYAEAGRRLSAVHLSYETANPYPLAGLDTQCIGDPYEFYAVGDRKMPFGKATPEQRTAGERHDRSVIHYNDRITLRGIPDEAYRYMLGSRSAIEWIIDRYYVKTDKASGIVNDPNDWSREVGDPRYILDLLARIVSVSLETMRIVDELPAFDLVEDGPTPERRQEQAERDWFAQPMSAGFKDAENTVFEFDPSDAEDGQP